MELPESRRNQNFCELPALWGMETFPVIDLESEKLDPNPGLGQTVQPLESFSFVEWS